MSNEDLGDSLDSVEALIKKHEDFEKSLAAQEEKILVSLHTITIVESENVIIYSERQLKYQDVNDFQEQRDLVVITLFCV